MVQRRIFAILEKHLTNKLITVITGMRRVGKSTTLKYLLSKIKHGNKIYLDLEKIENRYLFNQSTYKDIEIGLSIEGLDLSKPAVVALDEVQLVPSITSVIKYLYDNYNIKFLISGSNSFYIKNRFSESLAGRKRIFELQPLDFIEFLKFKEIDTSALMTFALSPFNESIFNKFKIWYEEFLLFGGFPEVVLARNNEDKIAYLKDVINAYIELDIKLLTDFNASNDLYRLIKLLVTRAGNKFDYQNLSNISGIHRPKIKEYIDLLEYTYFIKTIRPFTKNPDREISLQRKMYFSDNGILNILGQVSTGQQFENAIAIQLSALGELKYYQRKTGQEIDFILNDTEAIEVKETPTGPDLVSISKKAKYLGIQKYSLIGRYYPLSDFREFTWGSTVFENSSK